MWFRLYLICIYGLSARQWTNRRKILLGVSSFSTLIPLLSSRTLTRRTEKKLWRPAGRLLSLVEPRRLLRVARNILLSWSKSVEKSSLKRNKRPWRKREKESRRRTSKKRQLQVKKQVNRLLNWHPRLQRPLLRQRKQPLRKRMRVRGGSYQHQWSTSIAQSSAI